MSFTITNWTCLSASLNQGQETVTPFGGSPTVVNSPNLFIYGSPTDSISTISTVGYFNPKYTQLSVGDWIIGNASDTSFIILITNITDGVVTVSVVFSGSASGAFFSIANNLSESTNKTALGVNIGLGDGAHLDINPADFSGSIYQMVNPGPVFLDVRASTPGLIVRTPSTQAPNQYKLGSGFVMVNTGSNDVEVQDNSGFSFFTLIPNAAYYFYIYDNSTSAGIWLTYGVPLSINSQTGVVTLTSNDGSVVITPGNSNIDLSVSPSSDTLQTAYDNGDGTITISQGKPIALKKNVSDQGAGLLLPSFTDAEVTALSNFNNSEMVWDSDTDRIVLNANTALDPRVESVAYLSDINNIETDASYGECYFQANSTDTTFASPATPVIVKGTYSDGNLRLFTHTNGVLTYIGTVTREFDVTAALTATYTGHTNNTTFMIAHTGSTVSKSFQSTLIGGTTPANQANPVSCILSLSNNDTVAVWVQNEDSTDALKVYDINFSVKSIGGVSSGSEITLIGEDYLDLTGTVLTANPVDLTGTNVTGILKTASAFALTGDVTKTTASLATTIANQAVTYPKIQNISTNNRLLGRYTAGAGSTQEITVGSGLTLSSGGTLSSIATPGVEVVGTMLVGTTSYTSGVLTSVISTISGTKTIPGNSMDIGQSIELSVIGLTSSVTSGGTGQLSCQFGPLLFSGVIASSTLGSGASTRNWNLNFKVTRVGSDQISASAAGFYEDDSHTVKSLRFYLTPPVHSGFDWTVDNVIDLYYFMVASAGNSYNFDAVNLNIIKYN